MAGQPAEAETTWRRILTLKRPEQFCSVDQGIYGHLTLRNLAALAQERGDASRSPTPLEVDPRGMSRRCGGDREARGLSRRQGNGERASGHSPNMSFAATGWVVPPFPASPRPA